MAEFLATIRFLGGLILLWRKFRELQARGEAEKWLREMEEVLNENLENADTSEKKRDAARAIMSLFMRIS